MEKKCKYCAMMIPKEARICPHCRKKQPGSIKVKVAFGALLFFAIMYAAANSPDTPGGANNQPAAVSLSEKAKKIKAKHPEWDNEDCNTIANKKIHAGMTAEQVRAAWGKPYKINSTITGSVIHEQWVMHENGNDYVYFENGIMTTLQQSK